MKIAVTGEIATGKDTFAEYLIDNYNMEQFAFGDGIGEVINRYFPQAFNEGKPRKHYQVIGQSFRELNPDIWIETLNSELTRFQNICGEDVPVIITDLRQPNEAEYLKRKGFTIVKVEAHDEIRLQRLKDRGDNYSPEDLNHETEIYIRQLPHDYLVTNNDTLEALFEQADFITKELKGV